MQIFSFAFLQYTLKQDEMPSVSDPSKQEEKLVFYTLNTL